MPGVTASVFASGTDLRACPFFSVSNAVYLLHPRRVRWTSFFPKTASACVSVLFPVMLKLEIFNRKMRLSFRNFQKRSRTCSIASITSFLKSFHPILDNHVSRATLSCQTVIRACRVDGFAVRRQHFDTWKSAPFLPHEKAKMPQNSPIFHDVRSHRRTGIVCSG